MTKVLITGGAGFIGSHLSRLLVASGEKVVVLDDLSTGMRENVLDLQRNENFELVVGSTTDTKLVDKLVGSVDQVFHLAASVGVKNIVDNLIDSITNNIQGTEVVLEAAGKHQVKVLLTSTSEVYGRSNTKPFAEDDDLKMGETKKTRWSYACSKALDEYLAFAYHYEKQLPVVVVRLFNTVGERQSDAYGMVLPTFVKQALAGDPLTVYGDGEQSRCFCHVSEVVDALSKLMKHPGAVGEVFNIGSVEEITMNQLAQHVIEVLKSDSKIVHIPYKEAYKKGFDDITRRVPNVSKVNALVGFESKILIDEIIHRTAIEFSEQFNIKEKTYV